jgi:hypothetical protein
VVVRLLKEIYKKKRFTRCCIAAERLCVCAVVGGIAIEKTSMGIDFIKLCCHFKGLIRNNDGGPEASRTDFPST